MSLLARQGVVSVLCQAACALVAGRLLLNVASGCYRRFLRPGKDLRKYGKWAVVTGATDGIGRAIAFELCGKGMSVMLVSRNESKLKETQAALLQQYPKAEVRYVTADLANLTPELRATLREALAAIEVGLLVNNAGMAHDIAFFHELPDQVVDNLVALNNSAVHVLTRLVLPQMLERKKGAVVNISSLAGEGPVPFLQLYAGSKAAVTMTTKALAAEYKPLGIDFQVQIPAFVETKMAKMRPGFFIPDAATFARCSVAAMGYESAVVPYWPHAMQRFWMKCFPEDILLPRLRASMQVLNRSRNKKVGGSSE